MKPRLRTRLLVAPRDLDYVEQFQLLAAVNLEMRRHGPTVDRLVRKAVLEMHVGNFSAALTAALDAATEDPTSAEAHYQAARAYILLALNKADVLPRGPGDVGAPEAGLEELVRLAMEELRTVIRLNLKDEDALETFLLLESLLESSRGEEQLAAALRAHVR